MIPGIPFTALLFAACNPTPKPAVASSAPPTAAAASSASALATMNALIHFENNQSNLSDSAKAILEEKVAIFRANPDMRIVILGYASGPGTENYNVVLGGRRAGAAQTYPVGRGIHKDRIEIVTRGKGELVVEGPGEAAAQNRHDEVKVLIGSGYLVQPKSKSKTY